MANTFDHSNMVYMPCHRPPGGDSDYQHTFHWHHIRPNTKFVVVLVPVLLELLGLAMHQDQQQEQHQIQYWDQSWAHHWILVTM